MGNCVAEVPGTVEKGPRIMLAAHLDEIGLIVTRVGDDGLLRFRAVGGVIAETLPGQPVMILPEGGEADRLIPGIIGWSAFARTSKEPPRIADLTIDIGCDGPDARDLVRPGDPAVVDMTPRYLGRDRLVARGLDDRIGAFIVAEVVARYAAAPGAATLVAAGTSMEEIGCYGAATVAYDRGITAALWVDTTYDTLLPGLESDTYGAHGIGSGPVLCAGGMISPVLLNGLRETATDLQISVQYEVCTNKTLTDGDFLHVTQRGLPQAGIFITARNVHTPCEMVSLEDVEHTIEILTAFVQGIPEDLDLRRV